MYIIALVCFLMYVYFPWEGTLNEALRLNCKISKMYVTLMNYRMKTKFVLAIYNNWCLVIRFGKSC